MHARNVKGLGINLHTFTHPASTVLTNRHRSRVGYNHIYIYIYIYIYGVYTVFLAEKSQPSCTAHINSSGQPTH